jgi:hypothetical protein
MHILTRLFLFPPDLDHFPVYKGPKSILRASGASSDFATPATPATPHRIHKSSINPVMLQLQRF